MDRFAISAGLLRLASGLSLWEMIVRDESTPLAQIVVDLLALRAGTELIDEITIDEAWIRVSRGPGVAETPFRLERVTLPSAGR